MLCVVVSSRYYVHLWFREPSFNLSNRTLFENTSRITLLARAHTIEVIKYWQV